jgi:hypothetical protein
MSDDAGPRIRFCDEYETLMSEFVRALSVWTRLSCLPKELSHSNTPSDSPVTDLVYVLVQPHSPARPAKAELVRSRESYAAAMWALRMHSRNCLLCEETLRVEVNGEVAAPVRLNSSCC